MLYTFGYNNKKLYQVPTLYSFKSEFLHDCNDEIKIILQVEFRIVYRKALLDYYCTICTENIHD